MGSTLFPPVPPPAGGTPNLPGAGQPAPLAPGEFVSGSVANVTTFGFDRISPPSALYIQRDDQLLLFGISNFLNESIVFRTRLLRVPEPQGGQPDQGGVGKSPGAIFNRGIIESIEHTMPLPTVGNSVFIKTGLAEGYLLSASAVGVSAVNRGRTFAKAAIVRGILNLQSTAILLFSDYVMASEAASWPGGRQLASTEGPGWVRVIQVTNPAAGVDWIFTATSAQRVRPISLQAQLAVANSGAARPVEVLVDDGANVYARMAANTTFPINATSNLNFSTSGTPPTSIVSDIYAQEPATLVLQPGHRIRSNTTNIVAGDQWSNIFLLVEEWLSIE